MLRRVVVLTLLSIAPAASAQESAAPATAAATSTTSWEVGGKASYLSPPIRGGANPFGPGLGGRLGVSIGAFYVGATVLDYFGSSDVDLTARALTYGGEAGYGLELGRGFRLRPSLGVGGLTAFYTTPNASPASITTGTSSNRTLAVQPVDVITTASTSSGRSSSSGGGLSSIFGSSDSSSTTTSTTALYFQPGLTLMLAASWGFVAMKGSAMVVPSIADGVGGMESWLMWGMDAELGLRF